MLISWFLLRCGPPPAPAAALTNNTTNQLSLSSLPCGGTTRPGNNNSLRQANGRKSQSSPSFPNQKHVSQLSLSSVATAARPCERCQLLSDAGWGQNHGRYWSGIWMRPGTIFTYLVPFGRQPGADIVSLTLFVSPLGKFMCELSNLQVNPGSPGVCSEIWPGRLPLVTVSLLSPGRVSSPGPESVGSVPGLLDKTRFKEDLFAMSGTRFD